MVPPPVFRSTAEEIPHPALSASASAAQGEMRRLVAAEPASCHTPCDQRVELRRTGTSPAVNVPCWYHPRNPILTLADHCDLGQSPDVSKSSDMTNTLADLSVPAQLDLSFIPVPAVGHMYIGSAMWAVRSATCVPHASCAVRWTGCCLAVTNDSQRSSSETRSATDTSSASVMSKSRSKSRPARLANNESSRSTSSCRSKTHPRNITIL